MYDDMEQDLILASKNWYGDNGIEKVIAHYCNCDIKYVNEESKYSFLSKLIIKLIKNNHVKLEYFINELSPKNINGFACMDEKQDTNTKIINRMISIISDLTVEDQDKDGNWYIIIEIHEPKEELRNQEESDSKA